MKADELHTRWILGPKFLSSERSKWLNGDEPGQSFKSDDPEVKKSVVMATSLFDKAENTLVERESRFSDWHRARRALALSMKYTKRLKRRTKGEPDQTVQISAEDLQEAGWAIIRSAQLNFFQEDIKVLTK